MQKNIWIIPGAAVLILATLTWKGFSQRDDTPVAVPLSAMEDIQTKLNNVLSSLEQVRAASLNSAQKLEQVLAAQAEIKEELNIIKIRAYRK